MFLFKIGFQDYIVRYGVIIQFYQIYVVVQIVQTEVGVWSLIGQIYSILQFRIEAPLTRSKSKKYLKSENDVLFLRYQYIEVSNACHGHKIHSIKVLGNLLRTRRIGNFLYARDIRKEPFVLRPCQRAGTESRSKCKSIHNTYNTLCFTPLASQSTGTAHSPQSFMQTYTVRDVGVYYCIKVGIGQGILVLY